MGEGYKVVWSSTALSDLDATIDYVAADSGVDRALKLYEKVRDQIDSLSAHPRRARVVPELERIAVGEFRELLLNPYRILFRLDRRKVVLVGVLDGRRDLEGVLVDRALRQTDR